MSGMSLFNTIQTNDDSLFRGTVACEQIFDSLDVCLNPIYLGFITHLSITAKQIMMLAAARIPRKGLLSFVPAFVSAF